MTADADPAAPAGLDAPVDRADATDGSRSRSPWKTPDFAGPSRLAGTPVAEADRVSYAIGGTGILHDVSFRVYPGERFGIIGPNGSGKSTLLRLLSGIERPTGGAVRLNGRDAAGNSRRELARWLAVLQQDPLPPVAFTVRDVVEMGRYPFQNWLGEESDPAQAEELAERALDRFDLRRLERRTLERLSGGERQRTALAKTLVQNPSLVLLDEPTAYLDCGHQVRLMDELARRQQERTLTVVAVLHDLNLAALYCDRLLLLDRGRVAACGSPDDVLRPEPLRRVYGVEPVVLRHPACGRPQLLMPAPAIPARNG